MRYIAGGLETRAREEHFINIHPIFYRGTPNGEVGNPWQLL